LTAERSWEQVEAELRQLAEAADRLRAACFAARNMDQLPVEASDAATRVLGALENNAAEEFRVEWLREQVTKVLEGVAAAEDSDTSRPIKTELASAVAAYVKLRSGSG
jgi:hypothetical protein